MNQMKKGEKEEPLLEVDMEVNVCYHKLYLLKLNSLKVSINPIHFN